MAEWVFQGHINVKGRGFSIDLENHALILIDHYTTIFSNKAIGMAFKWP